MPSRDFDPTSEPASSLLRSHADVSESPEKSNAPTADRDACRAGDDSCANAHASTLNRATDSQPSRARQSLLQLQKQYGNRYVERVLALARENLDRQNVDRQVNEHNEVSPDLEHDIQQERGGGSSLDHGVRRQMESSFGADFGGVRIHTDHTANSLSQDLSARAFTTGQDIFFRQGAYQPENSGGRELIAHELTHVVQQGGGEVHRAMAVSQPNDPHEVEAEQTARAVMEQEHLADHAREKDKNKKEEEHAILGRSESVSLQRQPEAAHGKDKEDEEKKKDHIMTKLDGNRRPAFADGQPR
jgi:hypothetical protein